MFALIRAGDAAQPRTAARKEVIAASNAVPSNPVYGFAPLTLLFQYAANAVPAGPPAALPAEPLSPLTGSPILSSVSELRSASIASVFVALHFPLRTRDGANFSKVSGKSMSTQPAGSPSTNFAASLSKFAWSGFQEIDVPMLPPSRFHSETNSAWSALPNASLRAPTFSFAPLPNFVRAAPASTLLWSASEGYARN